MRAEGSSGLTVGKALSRLVRPCRGEVYMRPCRASNSRNNAVRPCRASNDRSNAPNAVRPYRANSRQGLVVRAIILTMSPRQGLRSGPCRANSKQAHGATEIIANLKFPCIARAGPCLANSPTSHFTMPSLMWSLVTGSGLTGPAIE